MGLLLKAERLKCTNEIHATMTKQPSLVIRHSKQLYHLLCLYILYYVTSDLGELCL